MFQVKSHKANYTHSSVITMVIIIIHIYHYEMLLRISENSGEIGYTVVTI